MAASMPLKAIVLGRTLIVRQPIAQSLAALDFQVIEAPDLASVMTSLDLTTPSLVVMDADGMVREWRMLAAGLNARKGATALVLVTSRFSFDDVHEAMALGVAGVIVKPFRREEHTARLLDLALRKMKVRARRAAPRFAIPDATRAVLTSSRSEGEEAVEIRNIAEGGAKLNVESAGRGGVFEPGGFVPLATLTWGEFQVEVSLEVVYRKEESAGIRFSRIFDGHYRLVRALEERKVRALGVQVRKRKW